MADHGIRIEQLNALADLGLEHRVRLRIVLYLLEHDTASPKEMAEAFDGRFKVAELSRNARVMRQRNVLNLERVAMGDRNTVSHYYALTPRARAAVQEALSA